MRIPGWKKLILSTAILIIFSSGTDTTVHAVPYESYTYNFWQRVVSSPAPYVPDGWVDGRSLGVGPFNDIRDVFVTADNKIYIVDSGNNRVLVFNDNWQHLRTVEHGFNKPRGVFVAESGEIYIADTENKRVVVVAEDGEFIYEMKTPQSEVLRDNFDFFPEKVAVDKANRIYVIARGVFDGIMEFDSQGEFTGFMGTNRVKFNTADYLWKRFSTTAQRSQMELFVPLEFNNLDINQDGMIYATTAEKLSNEPIKKLNPTGIDVLIREGYHPPMGDLLFTLEQGTLQSTALADVSVDEYGSYSVLDSYRGRVFTYSQYGELLYLFGGMGNRVGLLQAPSAIARLHDRMLIADRKMNRILLFRPTPFGHAVNEAVRDYVMGREDASEQSWRQVLKFNTNYDLAYIGIGKALLRKGQNKEAMHYFKQGQDREYYSKAYQRYRKETMREHFGTLMTLLLVVCIGIFTGRIFSRRRRERNPIVKRSM